MIYEALKPRYIQLRRERPTRTFLTARKLNTWNLAYRGFLRGFFSLLPSISRSALYIRAASAFWSPGRYCVSQHRGGDIYAFRGAGTDKNKTPRGKSLIQPPPSTPSLVYKPGNPIHQQEPPIVVPDPRRRRITVPPRNTAANAGSKNTWPSAALM